MPRAERHHIVPHGYLLRFATDDGELAMFDKLTREWIDNHAPTDLGRRRAETAPEAPPAGGSGVRAAKRRW